MTIVLPGFIEMRFRGLAMNQTNDSLNGHETPSTSPLPVLALPIQTTAASKANRRLSQRIQTTFTVRVADGRITLEGLDLSPCGMLCCGAEPIWPGNELPLQLVLPGDALPLAVVGRVVELVCSHGLVAMRVRFETVEPVVQRRIVAWIESRPFTMPGRIG